MTELAKKHKDQLDRLKSNVESFHDYFKDNYDRFDEFKKLVHVSSISGDEAAVLAAVDKPVIEFNILEAFINRNLGEFSKQEPSITVSSHAGSRIDPQMISLVEDHMRHVLFEANKTGMEYEVYRDTLTGGFSGIKVYTDYMSSMSFQQEIYMERVFDPTMTGFDPTARDKDKGDGEYCFEVYPKRRDEFERDHPNASAEKISFTRDISGFSWAYKNVNEDILLLVDYYEKKRKKEKIVLLTNNETMTLADYNKLLKRWDDEGIIAQAPQIVGKPRVTEIAKIVRYQLVENQVLSYEETNYRSLPIIFVDGDSVLCKGPDNTSVKQFTKPYIHKAVGVQKLKNFAGQSLANELENMSMAKMTAPKDGIPPQYIDAYLEPQKANIYIYNQFKDDNPDIRLDPPQVIPRPQIPPEITQTFIMTDTTVQNILGSYDASLAKVGEHQVSGVAIQESASLSNAATMPYITSFLKGLQSAAQLVMELIPLYYTTPRSIPVMDSRGKRSFVEINEPGGIRLAYDVDDLQIEIDAGVNFEIQQSRALNQLIQMSQASPTFAEFINKVGLPVFLDNLSIRGIDALKEQAEQFMQQQAQAAEEAKDKPDLEEQAIQIAAQQVQTEAQLGQQKIQLDASTEQGKAILKQNEIEIGKQKNQIEILRLIAQIQKDQSKLDLETQKVMNETIETALKTNKAADEKLDKQMERTLGALESVQVEEAPPAIDTAMEAIITGEE